MNKLKSKAIKALLILALALASAVASTSQAYAAYDPSSILKRTMVNALMYCYSQGKVTNKFESQAAFEGAESLSQNGASSMKYALPSGTVFSNIPGESVDCHDVIAGKSTITKGSISNAYELAGHPVPKGSSDSSASEFLTKYAGYKAVKNKKMENGKCVFGVFKKTTYKNYIDSIKNQNAQEEEVSTNPLCAGKITNGKIDGDIELNKKTKPGYSLGFRDYGDAILVNTNSKVVKIAISPRDEYYGTFQNYKTISYADTSWDSFVSQVNDAFGAKINKAFNQTLKDQGDEVTPPWTKMKTIFIKAEQWDTEQAAQETGGYELDDPDGKKTAAALLGVDKKDVNNAVQITAQEQVHLYMYYLTDIYKSKVDCTEMDQNAATANGFQGPIKWFKPGETAVTENCYVTSYYKRGTNGGSVNGLSSKNGGTFYRPQNLNFEQLIEYFKTLKITELDDAAGSSVTKDDTDADPSEREPDCHTNGGALAWLLCPVIEASSIAVEKVYSGFIEPYLSIDAVLFDTNSQGGAAVHEIWSKFQGFANLAFVIVFLFVIFSQLTGVGIDNYGIKKILPKLIIGAVLINTSYIICQLSVDISNILGRAVKGLFDGISGGLGDSLSSVKVNLNESVATPVSGKFDGATLAVVGIASALGVGAFLAAGFAILIPAIVALVSLIVGVLFLFIMLALRQAIAVILVIVSPLAFAAYILPNTKKMIFDKWLEAFKGMLIAYPICSALVYGGDCVSKILIVAETGNASRPLTSLGMTLSAAAVAIAPIFFIPSMIRKGMNAIGGLGNMLGKMHGSVGGAVGKATNERLQNSRLADYQNRRRGYREAVTKRRRQDKEAQRARQELDGTRFRDKVFGALTNTDEKDRGLQHKVNEKGISNLSAGQKVRYQQAVGRVSAYNKEMAALYEDSFSTMTQPEIEAQVAGMLESHKFDINLATAAVNKLGHLNQGDATDAVAKISNMDSFKHASTRDINSFIGCLAGQKGNIELQAYAKGLGRENDMSFETFKTRDERADNNMTSTIKKMGNNVFNDVDRDSLEHIARDSSVAGMFTPEQMDSLFSSGLTGNTGTAAGKLVDARYVTATDANGKPTAVNQRIIEDVQKMSTAQISSVAPDMANQLKSLLSAAGTDIKTTLRDQITDLQSEQNARLLANTARGTRNAYGIPASQTRPAPSGPMDDMDSVG